MSKSKNHYRNETELVGGFVSIFLMASLVVAYVLWQVSFFIVITFCKYYKQRVLWIALVVAVLVSAAGVVLFKVFAGGAFLLLIPAGITGLLITCLSVQLNCSESLMRESPNLLSDALHTSWWSSDSAPRNGVENEQAAA
jgi:hypothetical protein